MTDEAEALKGWRKLPPVPSPATVSALKELATIKSIEELKRSPNYYPPYRPYEWKWSYYDPEQEDEDLD